MVADSTTLLLSVVTFQALFISFFLFTTQTGKRLSHRLLGSFFLALSLNLVDSFLLLSGFYFSHPVWALWGTGIPLLFGPALYLYTLSIIDNDFRLSIRQGWHLLPFGLLTSASLLAYHTQTSAQQALIIQSVARQDLSPVSYVFIGLIALHFWGYLLLALRAVRQYRRTLLDYFSEPRSKQLTWLSSVLTFFLLVFLLSISRSFLPLVGFDTYHFVGLVATMITLFVFFNRFLLKALRQPTLFSGIGFSEVPLSSLSPAGESPGTDPEQEAALRYLRTYMETHKPYLEPELTLEQLARRLSIRPKALSQLINDALQQHFFDFINRYRIEEAKRLLTQPTDPKATVLEVMYAVGFNSKSSFNTLFKKYTGTTPSEFKKGAA